MAINPQSLIKTYDEFSQFDPAFRQLADDAPEDEVAAYAATVERCRETGTWTELLVEGQTPTKFRLRPIPGNVARALRDILSTRGPAEMASLYLRAALIGVENLASREYAKAKLVNEPGIPGQIADVDIPNQLDTANPMIVSELGALVFKRAEAPSPRH